MLGCIKNLINKNLIINLWKINMVYGQKIIDQNETKKQ